MSPEEELAKLKVIAVLAWDARGRIYCMNPGGRFGEDECRRCAACELIAKLLEFKKAKGEL